MEYHHAAAARNPDVASFAAEVDKIDAEIAKLQTKRAKALATAEAVAAEIREAKSRRDAEIEQIVALEPPRNPQPIG